MGLFWLRLIRQHRPTVSRTPRPTHVVNASTHMESEGINCLLSICSFFYMLRAAQVSCFGTVSQWLSLWWVSNSGGWAASRVCSVGRRFTILIFNINNIEHFWRGTLTLHFWNQLKKVLFLRENLGFVVSLCVFLYKVSPVRVDIRLCVSTSFAATHSA